MYVCMYVPHVKPSYSCPFNSSYAALLEMFSLLEVLCFLKLLCLLEVLCLLGLACLLCLLEHGVPTQSVGVADCYFIVNVLDLPFASPIPIYR